MISDLLIPFILKGKEVSTFWSASIPTWVAGFHGQFILSLKFYCAQCGHNKTVFHLSGWPRHRENREKREFGSYFFQTGKTQGILLWHRAKFWDAGKIFFCDTGKNLDIGKIFDCDYWNKKYGFFSNFKIFLPRFAWHKSSLQSIMYFYFYMLYLLFYLCIYSLADYINTWYLFQTWEDADV